MEALENSFVQLLTDSDEEADNEDVSGANDGLLADAVESSDVEDSEGKSDAVSRSLQLRRKRKEARREPGEPTGFITNYLPNFILGATQDSLGGGNVLERPVVKVEHTLSDTTGLT
ncbi:unnamed protein product [Haemonchus placei]|uniref:Vacuolar protein sorting-associated protein 72 homolog n=1 Tax=Haemonchus placei TaxID=6290 RepID=A0A0N4WSS0_HAEPC|nr:unnamed protein product [Haemonchus placei]